MTRKITTDYLRSWFHCPLQAELGYRNGILPPTVIARGALALAVNACIEDDIFYSSKLPKAWDQIWSKHMLNMDMMTFTQIGVKFVETCSIVARVVNNALDSGWRFCGNAKGGGIGTYTIELEPLIGSIGKDLVLAHDVDLTFAGPDGIVYLVTINTDRKVELQEQRALLQSVDIQLGSVITSQNHGFPMRQALLHIGTEKIQNAVPGEYEYTRTLGWLSSVARAIKAKAFVQRGITTYGCSKCPVQAICDDSRVYHNLYKD